MPSSSTIAISCSSTGHCPSWLVAKIELVSDQRFFIGMLRSRSMQSRLEEHLFELKAITLFATRRHTRTNHEAVHRRQHLLNAVSRLRRRTHLMH